MPATFHSTPLPGVILVKPKIFCDDRGYFKETYHQASYSENGIPADFVQDNFSRSTRNTLRGLHFQYRKCQAKLIQCLNGAIYDVAVDIRPFSPTYRRWYSAELTSENHHQLFIPAGFAHGFCVISDNADLHYKCTNVYTPEYDTGIHWQSLDIPWPVETPILSEKDAGLPLLDEADPIFTSFDELKQTQTHP